LGIAALGLGLLLGGCRRDRAEPGREPAESPSTQPQRPTASAEPDTRVRSATTPASAAAPHHHPPPSSCARRNLIADFEDGNPTVCVAAGRGGPLVLYSDGTGSVEPPPGEIVRSYPLPKRRGRSRGGLRVVGQNHRIYGVGIAAHLAAGMLVDVTGFQGVMGWFRSTRQLTIDLKLATRQTMTSAYGGTCEPTEEHGCSDHYGVRRAVGPEWQLIRAPIAEMKQLENGVRVPFDPTQVVEFHVRIPKLERDKELSFELLIDDLAFY
jgi:hypothetical protein